MERKTKAVYRQSGRDHERHSHCCCGRIPPGRLRARPGFPVNRPAIRRSATWARRQRRRRQREGDFPGGSTSMLPASSNIWWSPSPTPTARIWGFQLTARPSSDSKTQAGSFTSTDRFTAVVCDVPPFNDVRRTPSSISARTRTAPRTSRWLTSSTRQTGSSRIQTGSQTYEFDWTPPATAVGNITIYVAGNAANGNGNETGDHIYTANYTLTPAAAGSGAVRSMRAA